MIGKLTGNIDAAGESLVVVDVNGVGYEVHCSAKTLAALPAKGERAVVFIETQVREDSIRLIGFAGETERAWFRLLTTVQGVGSKVALAVLSVLSADELAQAVALQDKAMVARAHGVGAKVAQRIVTELKDKVPALAPADPALARLQADLERSRPSPARDAVSALVNLGYGQTQAGAAVAAALQRAGEAARAEALIRLALQELGR